MSFGNGCFRNRSWSEPPAQECRCKFRNSIPMFEDFMHYPCFANWTPNRNKHCTRNGMSNLPIAFGYHFSMVEVRGSMYEVNSIGKAKRLQVSKALKATKRRLLECDKQLVVAMQRAWQRDWRNKKDGIASYTRAKKIRICNKPTHN